MEDASGRAAAETFGTKHPGNSKLRQKHSAEIQAHIADVHLHDAAYAEGTYIYSPTGGC